MIPPFGVWSLLTCPEAGEVKVLQGSGWRRVGGCLIDVDKTACSLRRLTRRRRRCLGDVDETAWQPASVDGDEEVDEGDVDETAWQLASVDGDEEVGEGLDDDFQVLDGAVTL